MDLNILILEVHYKSLKTFQKFMYNYYAKFILSDFAICEIQVAKYKVQ